MEMFTIEEDEKENEKNEKENEEKLEEIAQALATPMAEENHKINSKILWEKAFHDIYLETYDFDNGYVQSKESFTKALLNSGAHESPIDLFRYLDQLTTRLQKIHTIKRVCCFLGLHDEMDKIVDHEMNLMYRHPAVHLEPKTRSVVIAGDEK